jgi:hypothetical protein
MALDGKAVEPVAMPRLAVSLERGEGTVALLLVGVLAAILLPVPHLAALVVMAAKVKFVFGGGKGEGYACSTN